MTKAIITSEFLRALLLTAGLFFYLYEIWGSKGISKTVFGFLVK
jgi:hypothetical protein